MRVIRERLCSALTSAYHSITLRDGKEYWRRKGKLTVRNPVYQMIRLAIEFLTSVTLMCVDFKEHLHQWLHALGIKEVPCLFIQFITQHVTIVAALFTSARRRESTKVLSVTYWYSFTDGRNLKGTPRRLGP